MNTDASVAIADRHRLTGRVGRRARGGRRHVAGVCGLGCDAHHERTQHKHRRGKGSGAATPAVRCPLCR